MKGIILAGNSKPVNLNDFIRTIEKVIGKKANILYDQIRQGDVVKTYSDISELKSDFNYTSKTNIVDGIIEFYKWYLSYMQE
ncbi:MAG: hypothetical protein KAT68_17880 [Bacteroidales bacterium]|nr:hypothetical protein [Bacteroidales bacterium]